MKRRKAIQKIAIGTGTFFILPAAIVSCEKDPDPDPDGNGNGGGNDIEINLDDAANAALKTVGCFIVTKGIIVANIDGSAFLALSSECTHEGCTIGFNSGNSTFPCPCHGSIFNSTGAVLQGPAATALKKYTVQKNGNILVLS